MPTNPHPHFNVVDVEFGWVIESVGETGETKQLIGVYRSESFARRAASHLEATRFWKTNSIHHGRHSATVV
jgi:hypothetical protein